MLSEAIIVAIIGGGVSILGVIIQKYKCNYKKRTFFKSTILNKKYYAFDNSCNNYNKNRGKYKIDENGKYKIIKENKKNGKYKIKLPPKLKLEPYGSGTISIYKEFFTNYGNCDFELDLSNIKGDVDLFIKRFDNNWKFVENGSVTTQPAINGYNKMRIISRIGEDDVKKEQIGVMVYSDENKLSCCNINGVNINIINNINLNNL